VRRPSVRRRVGSASTTPPPRVTQASGRLCNGRPAGYYLARPPSKLRPILAALAGSGLTPRGDGSRIVVDKALGEDAASARELDSQLGALSEES
jgi:glucose-6-phosphate 1-dehydrogenase